MVRPDWIVQAVEADRAITLDAALPVWTRRSHPIVRRHLGIFWKVTPPNVTDLRRAVLVQGAYIAASLLLPFLITMLMPTVILTLVLLPIGLYLYAGMLFQVGGLAAAHVADERRSDSLDLLRVSPIPLPELLASKIAAAVWRHMETLTFLLIGVTYFSLPLLVLHYELIFADTGQPLLARGLTFVALIVSVIRLPLEAVYVAAIGVVVGAVSRWRVSAMVTTALLSAAYFGLLNLLRLLPSSPAGVVMVEIALPLLLPVIGITVCLWAAVRLLDQ